MKNSLARIAALAFVSLFSFVSGSAAGTNTLNYPYGLAVDGKRNLYAATATTTRSLSYNASHVLVPSKAFDSAHG